VLSAPEAVGWDNKLDLEGRVSREGQIFWVIACCVGLTRHRLPKARPAEEMVHKCTHTEVHRKASCTCATWQAVGLASVGTSVALNQICLPLQTALSSSTNAIVVHLKASV